MAVPTNTKNATPLISEKAWANLLELTGDSGDDVVAEIGNAFLSQIQEMGLKFHAAANNAKAFGELAHNLKSSAAGVGAEALAQLAQDWESRTRKGELPNLEALAKFDKTLTDTALELRRRLAATKPKAA